MAYVKINGDETHYNVSIMPFTTQHGYKAIRFIGEEIPQTNMGFKYFDDNDNEISDFSNYIYFYRDNEYSIEEDEIVLPVGNNDPIPPSYIDVQINRLNSQINAITPYTESKTAYIGDTECIFNLTRIGNVTAWMTSNELQIPCNVEVVENKIIVRFNELEDIATVNISVQ